MNYVPLQCCISVAFELSENMDEKKQKINECSFKGIRYNLRFKNIKLHLMDKTCHDVYFMLFKQT